MQIEYPPFEKNFYDEHEEITSLTPQQVVELRHKLNLRVSMSQSHLLGIFLLPFFQTVSEVFIKGLECQASWTPSMTLIERSMVFLSRSQKLSPIFSKWASKIASCIGTLLFKKHRAKTKTGNAISKNWVFFLFETCSCGVFL